ncbi:hypothetical protein EYF80_010217 [Liparis tanakae]|uniref:Uncharacterized protein n=1 Tax=Liparis tanakae TaxID=230148 RepID=A0A4Z2IP07_9TELE|nr:hypothetical protein EYF80_010217 [Liparis tanakae]
MALRKASNIRGPSSGPVPLLAMLDLVPYAQRVVVTAGFRTRNPAKTFLTCSYHTEYKFNCQTTEVRGL